MPQSIAPDALPSLFKPGMTVYMPNCAGESLLFADVLQRHADACAGVHFVGVWIPGVNQVDYAALHEEARATSFFVTPALRKSFAAGKVDFLPMHYSDVTPCLRSMAFDLALLHVSPPDADGNCSFGIAADFPPSIVGHAKKLVAHINPNMPAPPDSPKMRYDQLDYIVEGSAALLEYDLGGENDALRKVGANVASLIRDGDTIQIGIGKIQATVLEPLGDRKNLRMHGGMICDPLIGLAQTGAMAPPGDRPVVCTGVAVGSQALYDFVADKPWISFRPATYTHDIGVLGGIDNLVAINSSIEIDLLGQANAEMIKGNQVSSAGGLVDFLRGARRSKGGRAIIALVSTTSDGKTSRIVPSLSASTAVSVARADVEYVITENGIADLRNKPLQERAEQLIEVAAAPQFRDELRAARDEIPALRRR
jgi:4-hydroxybutyrate CoA-transferase